MQSDTPTTAEGLGAALSGKDRVLTDAYLAKVRLKNVLERVLLIHRMEG
ncbi:hypothetical protein [Deinococcus hopiensis]|uniref:Uncharacterized protein n=1 Tax=Deinococcus hopiensis KR-140 TaxID=695939 RepID=A0A1W1UQJ9_9DEIO|nr:hypothetical protein [Deinococcus hopiensis]SMB83382.1 hypothetical protein SAMN00790413_04399 [Deinococcus hopiensis KR-140]